MIYTCPQPTKKKTSDSFEKVHDLIISMNSPTCIPLQQEQQQQKTNTKL